MSPDQPWLIPYKNPLKGQMGQDFLKKIPKTPGVYLMLGEQGRVLYVGKAKSLRDRLASYGRAKPNEVSRKVIRMLNAVREIRIEQCATETEALLRENSLLREIKPPFNRQNTRPESYYLIGLKAQAGGALALRLTTRLEAEEGEELFGAFKGRGTTRRGFGALLRLLWVAHAWPGAAASERFEFPLALCRDEPVLTYSLTLRNERVKGPLGVDTGWDALLVNFLRGSSRTLLPALSARILLLGGIPPFFNKWIEDDLTALAEFFDLGPKRNRRLKRFSGEDSRLIAQEKIDDLLVTYSQRKKNRK
jgi:hypothetical protein